MLVFGDAARRENVADKLSLIRDLLARSASVTPRIIQHGFLVAGLIEAGELAQGLADHAFAERGGRDGPSDQADAAMALTFALARLVGASWCGAPADGSEIVASLREPSFREGEITTRLPEGFAHYSVYPEGYYEAARALAGRNLRVIGIRSIGTTLAAMVAAGADAPCPVTVRPVGHPFRRELSLASDFRLLEGSGPGAEAAIVDEGPGMSGSSFAAVSEALAAEGLGADGLHLFPSHANGPGAQADQPVRAFWERARVHLVSFDKLTDPARKPFGGLQDWVSDLTGPATSPIQELSAGRWRCLRYQSEADWPPVHGWQERRKFVIQAESGAWLVKFAGLGRTGLAKYERARELAEAGFVPRPLGYRHGFLVERWHGEAGPPQAVLANRAAFLEHVARYLGFRARRFRVDPGRGASCAELFEMLRVNGEEAFGPAIRTRLLSWTPLLPALEAQARPIETDSRLHLWEWLPIGGRILKADALDHHIGHDLVGCQDVSWDVAGAIVEFGLGEDERARLVRGVEREGGCDVDPMAVRFMTLCYCAFQLGYYREAVSSAPRANESARLNAAAERYLVSLRQRLGGDTSCGSLAGS